MVVLHWTSEGERGCRWRNGMGWVGLGEGVLEWILGVEDGGKRWKG